MEKEAQASEIEGATPPTAESREGRERGERQSVQSRNFRYGITVNAAAAAVPPPRRQLSPAAAAPTAISRSERGIGIAQQYSVL